MKKLACSQKKPQDAVEKSNITKAKLFLREIRQAKSCFIVVVCFFVLALLQATIATQSFMNTRKIQDLAAAIWIVSIIITNSSVNLVIFFWLKTM